MLVSSHPQHRNGRRARGGMRAASARGFPFTLRFSNPARNTTRGAGNRRPPLAIPGTTRGVRGRFSRFRGKICERAVLSPRRRAVGESAGEDRGRHRAVRGLGRGGPEGRGHRPALAAPQPVRARAARRATFSEPLPLGRGDPPAPRVRGFSRLARASVRVFALFLGQRVQSGRGSSAERLVVSSPARVFRNS